MNEPSVNNQFEKPLPKKWWLWLVAAGAAAAVGFGSWIMFSTGANPILVHGLEILFVLALVIFAIISRRRDHRQAYSNPQTHNPTANGMIFRKEAVLESTAETKDHQLEAKCQALAATYGLSTREYDVLLLLARGFKRREIEQDLIISENTVKSHIRRIYNKLGIHSREELYELLGQ